MLTTGTPVTVPLRSACSSSRISRVTAAIEEYSQPWMPPMTLTLGPPSPTLKAGTSSPARVIVVRTDEVQSPPTAGGEGQPDPPRGGHPKWRAGAHRAAP